MALGLLREANPGLTFDTRVIQTQGDRSDAPLTEIGGRGVFAIEIERALLAGEIDLAVHSLKDLPADETPGLLVAATPVREDPRDVLVSRGDRVLADLPFGAVIGTGSPRRATQLLTLRPDLETRQIRGNVDTRVRKVDDGEYDAVILAKAGLSRLGIAGRASQVFDPRDVLPAPGQGALAIQVRADDAEALAIVATIDHFETHAAVTAERAFERRLGGGCRAAVAAYATLGSGPALVGQGWGPDRTSLLLRGLAGEPGGRIIRGEMEGVASEAGMLGVRLAEFLIAQGADELLAAAEARTAGGGSG
jgi:hydroxymethylbilane synthase